MNWFKESQPVAEQTVESLRQRLATGMMLWRGVKGEGVAPADPGDLGIGTYYSTAKARAKQYGDLTQDKIVLQNPLIMTDHEAYRTIADEFQTVIGTTESRKRGAIAATKKMMEDGHDGLVSIRSWRGLGEIEVVVFPEQIPIVEEDVVQPKVEENELV
tara:strand:+ start:1161 stop:1637 length:477 start_codon:yes stop_codon:yes gene_type:complete